MHFPKAWLNVWIFIVYVSCWIMYSTHCNYGEKQFHQQQNNYCRTCMYVDVLRRNPPRLRDSDLVQEKRNPNVSRQQRLNLFIKYAFVLCFLSINSTRWPKHETYWLACLQNDHNRHIIVTSNEACPNNQPPIVFNLTKVILIWGQQSLHWRLNPSHTARPIPNRKMTGKLGVMQFLCSVHCRSGVARVSVTSTSISSLNGK